MKKKYLFILIITLLTITGCFNNDAYVDNKNKLTDNEIKIYIVDNLKEIYNKDFKIELFDKNNIELCGFSIDVCHTFYKVKGAYSYIYKITDPNGISAYATYTDPYYDNSTLHKESYNDNYNMVYNASLYIDNYKQNIYSYLDEIEIDKIEFDSSQALTIHDNVFLNIYLKLNLEDITSEIYGKLHNLSYDLSILKSNLKNTVLDIRVIFLNSEKFYNIDTIYGIKDNDTFKYLIPDNYYEYDFNLLNDTCKKTYNDVYNYLINTINMTPTNAKITTDAFIKYSHHYIYNIESISHQYYQDSNKCIIKIENKTKNNNNLGIEINLMFDQEKNTYIGNSVYLLNGSTKNSINTIISSHEIN